MGMLSGAKKGWDKVRKTPGIKQVVDVHDKALDGLGINAIANTFTGPGISRPDLSAEEAAREAILADLEAGVPAKFIEEKYAGNFTPTQIKNLEKQKASELKNIKTDPNLKKAQMAALEQLQSRATDGYNIEDRAAINRTLNEASMQERASRDALMANAQSRGVGGSGVNLAQTLAAQQGSANRSNQNSLDIAAEGRRRALEAAMMSGQLGGQMQSQDFDQQARIATAQDAINQFNTRNVNDLAYYNNGLVNSANLGNIERQQAFNSRDASGRNTFNQNQFDNKNAIAQTKYNHVTNGMNNKLGQYQGQVDARNRRQGAIFGAAGTAIGAAYGGPGGAQIGGQLGQAAGTLNEKDY